MGFKLNPSANDVFVTRSAYDEMLDEANSSIPDYIETGDLKHLKFVCEDDEKPVEFTHRTAAWDDFQNILMEADGDFEAALVELFRTHCRRIENMFDEDGNAVPMRRTKRAGSLDRMDERTFCRIPRQVETEQGTLIFNRSGLRKSLEAWAEKLSEVQKRGLEDREEEHRGNS